MNKITKFVIEDDAKSVGDGLERLKPGVEVYSALDVDQVLAEQLAEIAELRAAMYRVEWQGMTHGALADYEGCPWCHQTEGQGHADDCTWKQLCGEGRG